MDGARHAAFPARTRMGFSAKYACSAGSISTSSYKNSSNKKACNALQACVKCAFGRARKIG
jgi:hypothetical protein